MTKCDQTWCVDHLVDDGMVLHASEDLSVSVTAGGSRERYTAHVAVERDDLDGHLGAPRVRLELDAGRGIPAGGLMTADEALELSRLLRRAAHVAQGSAPRLRRPVAVQ